MKKLALFLSATALLFCLDACNKEKNYGNLNSVAFRKADISGSTMLALTGSNVRSGIATKGDNETVLSSQTLYKVSEDGRMVEVEYQMDIQGEDEAVQKFREEVKLVIQHIYPIGAKWLLLFRCNYDFPNWNNLPKSFRHAVTPWKDSQPRELAFLLRKSDGALFQWDGYPDQFPIKGNRRESGDICGVIEAMGEDIVALNDAGQIIYLKDQGNTISVSRLTPSNLRCGFVAPTADGYVGTSVENSKAYLVNTATTGDYNLIGNYFNAENGHFDDLYNPNSEAHNLPADARPLLSVGGKLYVVEAIVGTRDGNRYMSANEFHEVQLYENEVRMGPVVASVSAEDGHQIGFNTRTSFHPVFNSPTMSWYNDENKKLYTFFPKLGTVTSSDIPEHFPTDFKNDYFDGIGYSPDIANNRYWKCVLGETTAQEIPINWNGIDISGAINIPNWVLRPTSMCFEADAKYMNGTTKHIAIPVTGDDAGIATCFSTGSNDAGQVLATLVRLN